jgi:UDPglucose 6-dehydrogenase
MRLAIVGTGYVGLVSGACLAGMGHDVVCLDRDAAKIARLRAGEVPIYEPGLDAVIAAARAEGRLEFTTDPARAVTGAQAVVIAVGTPGTGEGGAADLSHLMQAARDIAPCLPTDARADPVVIVTKSTVPVGTNRALGAAIRTARPGARFDLASNPEFLREGVAVRDFQSPDRLVLGAETDHARAVLRRLYAPLIDRGVPVVETGLETAEMIKYAANTFLATKISFINDIAALCERVGADAGDVATGIGLDPRIGAQFLRPGAGFGGSCFPKDMQALVRLGQQHGAPQRIAETVIAVNEGTRARMVDKIVDLCGGSVRGQVLAVLGVTFKPDTDDVRSAPSLTIVPALQAQGARVRLVDPQGRPAAEALLPGADWHADPVSAAQGAGALVILTEWAAFRSLDLRALAAVMETPRLADLRNVYDRATALGAGFVAYAGVGR